MRLQHQWVDANTIRNKFLGGVCIGFCLIYILLTFYLLPHSRAMAGLWAFFAIALGAAGLFLRR